MTNSWFKFYGPEYLSDPKVLALDAVERSCWLTLLCYACAANDSGRVKHLDADIILIQSGVRRDDPQYETHRSFIDKFKKLEMITLDNGVITIKNWQKRQERSLTPYERIKRHRAKKRNDNANDNPRIEKNRIDKKRKEGDTPAQPAVVRFTPKDMESVETLVELIQKRNPAWVMKASKDSWAEDINKIHRIDGRTYEQINFMIRWVQADEFWAKNILSASKLREKFNDLIPKLQKIKSSKLTPNYVA